MSTNYNDISKEELAKIHVTLTIDGDLAVTLLRALQYVADNKQIGKVLHSADTEPKLDTFTQILEDALGDEDSDEDDDGRIPGDW